MKILVVSLLRLGDLIMQQPILRQLRLQYPDADIHLLLNRQFSSSKFLISDYVNEFHYFERDLYQQSMGNPEYNILHPYSHLRDFINGLRKQEFNLIVNLTHNRLSAHICGLLQVSDVRGAFFSNDRFHGINNRWMNYFDQRFAHHGRSIFHYIETLSSSFNFKIPSKTTSVDQVEMRRRIFIQPLTSDRKKNWSIVSYQALLRQMKMKYHHFDIKIIGAPFEKKILEQYFSNDDIAIFQLIELNQQLKECRALITGDTSIMHMAAQQGVPLLEIAIGSADYLKTGPYSDCFRVLQSQVSCYPCQHSDNCFQPTQFCAHEITVTDVLSNFQLLLNGEFHNDSIFLKNEKQIWRAYLNHETCPEYLIDRNHLNEMRNFALVLNDIVNQENFGPEQAQLIVQLLSKIKRSQQDISYIFNPLEIIQHTNYPNLQSLAIQLKKASENISEQILFRQKSIEVDHAQRN